MDIRLPACHSCLSSIHLNHKTPKPKTTKIHSSVRQNQGKKKKTHQKNTAPITQREIDKKLAKILAASEPVYSSHRLSTDTKQKTQTPPAQNVPGSRLVSLRRRRKKKEPDLQRWIKWRRGHAQRAAPWPKNYATTANPKMLAAELYSENTHSKAIHSESLSQ